MTVVGAGNAAGMQAVEDLMSRIASICQIDGVNIGSVQDPATWTLVFNASSTLAQQQAAQAILSNFNFIGEATYQSALASGLTLTWTTSTALNDTYAIDVGTQVRMLAERVNVAVNSTFTNGTTTLTWYGITGIQHTMTVTQAGLFIRAIWQYLSALFVARAVAASGGTPSWPSSTVSITG